MPPRRLLTLAPTMTASGSSWAAVSQSSSDESASCSPSDEPSWSALASDAAASSARCLITGSSFWKSATDSRRHTHFLLARTVAFRVPGVADSSDSSPK